VSVIEHPASVAQAGGPTRVAVPESAVLQVGRPHRWHYKPQPPAPGYRVALAPYRLTALFEATDEGFVATCPQLATLGYGRDPESAMRDLTAATRDYLSILSEDSPPLSPEITHHTLFLPLLRFPDSSWFAAIVGLLGDGRDAS